MPLPPSIALAITAVAGGRVTLVIGAGSSVEDPTRLLSSREYARRVHEALVDQGILANGACQQPEDLAKVADALIALHGSQEALVNRLPIDGFRNAAPNTGHLIAAALLREQRIGTVVTLNFDLAMSTALSSVNARDEVSILAGPEDQGRLGGTSLIYLHRNAWAPSGDWVISTVALERGWQDGWIEAIVHRALMGPVVIFAGIGTRIDSLVESARRLRNMLPGGHDVFHVGPEPAGTSDFFGQLNLAAEAHLQRTWCQFMERLAEPVVRGQVEELRGVSEQRCKDEGWDHGDLAVLCDQLRGLGLLDLGRLRARWLASKDDYLPGRSVDPRLFADLIQSIDLVQRATGRTPRVHVDGVIDFVQATGVVTSLVVASGAGLRLASALEVELRSRMRYWQQHYPRPRYALVANVEGGEPEEASAPPDIVVAAEPDDLVTGVEAFRVITARYLRAHPELAHDLVS